MVKFLDGPAVDNVLTLHRAPLFLRALQSPTGDWDALDQLTDTAGVDERIVVYRRVAGPWRVHINRGRAGSGWYQAAEYRVVEPAPADAAVRETSAWRTWCEVNARVGAEQATA